jgi:hypothetical protein
VPLPSTQDHYCPNHTDEQNLCCVRKCREPHEQGFCTCSDPKHRAVETAYKATGTSFFTLQAHLKRAKVTHPNDSLAECSTEDVLEIDGGEEEEFVVPDGLVGKDDGPLDADPAVRDHLSTARLSKHVKAQFGQARTHNEQFIIAPCGMIIARKTMFFAEALSEVAIRCNYL